MRQIQRDIQNLARHCSNFFFTRQVSLMNLHGRNSGLRLLAVVACVIQAGSHPLLGDATYEALEIQTTDTPRLRLETTGMSAIQWDLLADEQAFTIRNTTSGRDVVVWSADAAASLRLGTARQVFIGAGGSTAALNIQKPAMSGAETIVRFEVADSTAALNFNNASSTDGAFVPRIQGTQPSANAAMIMEGLITTDSGSNPTLVYNAALAAGGAVVTRPLVVYRNNNVAKATITANGAVIATSFNPVSSRLRKRNIVALDSPSALAAVRQLQPVQFIYNDDATAQQRLGFIAEDVPGILASTDRKSVPLMDTVAVMTRVVQDQQASIESSQEILQRQRKSFAAETDAAGKLNRRIETIEQMFDREIRLERDRAKALDQLRQRLELLERQQGVSEDRRH